MVITVTCPSCSSSFPVESDKIPEKGVSARCSTCGDVFRIEKPTESEAAPPPVSAPPEPEPVAAPPADPPPLPPPSVPEPSPAAEPPAETPAPADVPELPVAETPVPDVPEPPPAEAPATGFRFGKRDPTDKAKRLARVLVSDMIMYNAERHATALENGSLKEDFEEEIDKSWKEFVEQVGAELADAEGRAFWTEALNDILAKGEQVF